MQCSSRFHSSEGSSLFHTVDRMGSQKHEHVDGNDASHHVIGVPTIDGSTNLALALFRHNILIINRVDRVWFHDEQRIREDTEHRCSSDQIGQAFRTITQVSTSASHWREQGQATLQNPCTIEALFPLFVARFGVFQGLSGGVLHQVDIDCPTGEYSGTHGRHGPQERENIVAIQSHRSNAPLQWSMAATSKDTVCAGLRILGCRWPLLCDTVSNLLITEGRPAYKWIGHKIQLHNVKKGCSSDC